MSVFASDRSPAVAVGDGHIASAAVCRAIVKLAGAAMLFVAATGRLWALANAALIPLATLAFIGVATPAHPQTGTFTPMNTPLDEDGVSAYGRFAPTECLVGSNLELRTMIAKASDLRNKQALRPDADAAHLKARAWTTASAILLDLQPSLLHATFQDHPALDRCTFVATITGQDGKSEMAYRFEMTRATHDKTDWSTYTQAALPDLAENFTLGVATAAHMKAENR